MYEIMGSIQLGAMTEAMAILHGHSMLGQPSTSTEITQGMPSSTNKARVAKEPVCLLCPLKI